MQGEFMSRDIGVCAIGLALFIERASRTCGRGYITFAPGAFTAAIRAQF